MPQYSKVTKAIKLFLSNQTYADLSALYTPEMEVQVNVAADGGEAVSGRRNTYKNDTDQWYNFRIPKNAKDNPHFKDYPLRFSLAEHAEAVGMTGWDWKNRKSRWVAFDFDDITGHAKGIGISDEELNQVREAAQAIPWVTVRRSTGGNGLHLYVFFADPPETANHTEHAALGRAVLAQMSQVANFDFHTKVDTCGGNMWVWHRKMIGPDGEKIGLDLLKQGKPLTEIPANWQVHLDVVRNRRTKVRVEGIPESEEDAFEQLAASRPPVKFGAEHHRLTDWLSKNGYTCVWDQDHRLLTTHTAALKAAHDAMKFKGVYETNATGREKGDHNCFCFPLPQGAWTVYRYSPGTVEANTWHKSEQGWTYCYFNQPCDLKAVALAYGGIKAPDGSFVMESSDTAKKVLKTLGADLELPLWITNREVSLKPRNGELLAMIPYDKNDTAQDMRQYGWLNRKGHWVRCFEITMKPPEKKQSEPDNLDDRIRHLVTPNLGDAGWMVCDTKGRWIQEPKGNVKSVLKSWNYSDSEAEAALGKLITNVWDLVNLPFQDEFPGDRRWNRDAAKLAFTPTDEDREMSHPHWDMIFKQCGLGLDEAVAGDRWCNRHNVRTGADYLRLWAAILFQRPTHSLPYLFFFSEQNGTGKSSFHQSLGLLMQDNKGCVEARTSLTSQSGFNHELAGAILCYVEEINLSNSRSTSYNRIKNWVTSDYISIHPKGVDPYMMINTTHWIQCSNDREAFPVFPGDSRVIFIAVPPLGQKQIPWEKMKQSLRKEAPDFLRTLLDIQLPESTDRLWLPVLETEAKREAIAAIQGESRGETQSDATQLNDEDRMVDAVRHFIAEKMYWEVEGQQIPIGRRQFWEGTFKALADCLGWENEPNQLSRVIRSVRERLSEHGIEIVLPEDQRSGNLRKVTIGESWLMEPEWSDEEIAADAERRAQFEDLMPLPGMTPAEIIADLENEAMLSDHLSALNR